MVHNPRNSDTDYMIFNVVVMLSIYYSKLQFVVTNKLTLSKLNSDDCLSLADAKKMLFVSG